MREPVADPVPGTVGEAVSWAERVLDEAGVAECTSHARLLLSRAMGVDSTWLFTHPEQRIPEAARSAFADLVARRSLREPLQHLLGETEFWSMRLAIGPGALIPRPETETLVEAVLAELGPGSSAPRLADVGTGSGCVALALLCERPLARVVGTDVSKDALAIALANATALGFDDRLELRVGHLAEPLVGLAPFDAVVANLPYVTEAEWKRLEPEVRDHDPRQSLVGGVDGTELIAELALAAPEVLTAGGLLALEVGAGQAREIARRLRATGYDGVGVREDLSGIERVVTGRRPA